MKHQDVTILLMDDDYNHANLFKTSMQRKGITSEIKHFSNSFSLKKYLFDKNIDHKKYTYLLVLDINIAGLDYENLLSNLEKEDTFRKFNIIELSNAHSSIKKENVLKRRSHALLTKPLIQSMFEEALSNLNIFIHNCKISCTKKLVMFKTDI